MHVTAGIVVNWNNDRLTDSAVQSLEAQQGAQVVPVIVDNGSANQAEATDRLRVAHPTARLVTSPTNLGYAGGCNLGLRTAWELGADYALLMNNDVRLAPDAIAQLVAALQADSQAAAAGPLVYYAAEPQKVWFGGGQVQFGPRVLQRHDLHDQLYTPAPGDRPRPTDWLSGAALLVKREAVDRAGPMDEAFFLYWEEVDWCFRVRRAGYRLLLVPQAKAWHAVGASGSTPASLRYYWERNRLLFIERWGTRSSKLFAMVKVRLRLMWWSVRGPGDDDVAQVRREAYQDYLHHRFGPRGASSVKVPAA